MSGVALSRAPTFHLSYRRLFTLMKSKIYRRSQPKHQSSLALGIHRLTGCPDFVLLEISEIATLGSWMIEETFGGTCHDTTVSFETENIRRQLRMWKPDERLPLGGTKYAAASIWNETANIYLDIVLNDFSPGK